MKEKKINISNLINKNSSSILRWVINFLEFKDFLQSVQILDYKFLMTLSHCIYVFHKDEQNEYDDNIMASTRH